MVIGDQFLFIGGEAVQVTEIAGDSAKKAIRDSLALVGFLKEALIIGITDEGNLRKNRGHVCADENHERRFFHAAVPLIATYELKALGKRILDVASKLLGFLNFGVARNFLDQVLQIVHGLPETEFSSRVATSMESGEVRKIQIIRFDSAGNPDRGWSL